MNSNVVIRDNTISFFKDNEDSIKGFIDYSNVSPEGNSNYLNTSLQNLENLMSILKSIIENKSSENLIENKSSENRIKNLNLEIYYDFLFLPPHHYYIYECLLLIKYIVISINYESLSSGETKNEENEENQNNMSKLYKHLNINNEGLDNYRSNIKSINISKINENLNSSRSNVYNEYRIIFIFLFKCLQKYLVKIKEMDMKELREFYTKRYLSTLPNLNISENSKNVSVSECLYKKALNLKRNIHLYYYDESTMRFKRLRIIVDKEHPNDVVYYLCLIKGGPDDLFNTIGNNLSLFNEDVFTKLKSNSNNDSNSDNSLISSKNYTGPSVSTTPSSNSKWSLSNTFSYPFKFSK